ncbi:type III-A CRISPR-associated RAMP protein Csm5 [Candidatus Poribacteria bacterium]|nr:MAG: type III-A CRISPR-associated RAMP protein Csm5 [Candidatus Poribacteria bacterium]
MVKYQLKTITPVHIGTGETLSQIDGFYNNGQWHRIDIDAVLATIPESELNRLTIAMGQHNFQWDKYLPTSQTSTSYTLPCPQDPRETEIREAMKDAFGRPMIPGSSIKGAIRTALLWDLIDGDNTEAKKELKEQLQRRDNRSGIGQKIEQQVLGNDPNHDLMRVVQVSDTSPIPIEALEMGVAWTVTLSRNNNLVQKREGNREYKTFIEQIRPEQTFDFSIKIDKSLFGQREKRELRYSDRQQRALCEELAEVCNFVANGIAKDEAEFYDYYRLPELANFYESLSNQIENLPDGVFVLPIGWGTGYRAKTVTELLAGDDDDLMNLRKRYGLGQSRSRRGHYHPEFPKTRRVLYDHQKPQSPLGWVQIAPV